MDNTILVGLLAGFLTTIGYIPQLIRGYRTKRMSDVSLFMPILLSVGMTLWMIYGILISDVPIILWNAISVILNLGMIGLTVKYKRINRKERVNKDII